MPEPKEAAISKRIMFLAWGSVTAYHLLAASEGYQSALMKGFVLVLFLVMTPLLVFAYRRDWVSLLELSIPVYYGAGALAVWLLPTLEDYYAAYPDTILFGLLFFAAVLSPIISREPFTMHYARKETSSEYWETPLFRAVNGEISLLWGLLFFVMTLISMVPEVWPGIGYASFFNWWLPILLFGVIGARMNKAYPRWRKARFERTGKTSLF